MAAELVSSVKSFNGEQRVYKHRSEVLNCDMTFGVYVPTSSATAQFAGLFYLSGLTCTHANFMEKSGFQRYASDKQMIVVHPDTSPRGVDLPGDSDSWDFGKGAGFYLDATEEPWSKHYKMYSYVTKELLGVVKAVVPQLDEARLGIFGHSMGGHGAMTIGLRNPALFKSISAFAPICHPTNCAWGKKGFTGYLGTDEKSWEQYDSALLVKSYDGPHVTILIDQGGADNFLKQGQLQPEAMVSTERVKIDSTIQEGYDHSYYFIASFMEKHFEHHAKILKK